jgi:hypothetical protein
MQMLTTVRVAPRRLTTQRWRREEQGLIFVILDSMGAGLPLTDWRLLPQRFGFEPAEGYDKYL